MTIIDLLTKQTSMTKGEEMLSTYILHNTEDVLNMTIHELSKASYSSSATIVRLCKKLGTKGFQDFKIQLSRELEKSYQTINDIDVNTPFDSNDPMIVISKKIETLTKETVQLSQSLLSDQRLKKATEMIMNANRIYAFGVSETYLKVENFQNQMLKIGYSIQTVPTQPDQVFLATHAKENDLAILVSYSGVTAEVINLAKILDKKKIPTIVMTSLNEGFLISMATLVIPLPDHEDRNNQLGSLASQISISYVFNVLYSCVFSQHFEKNKYLRDQGTNYYLHK